MLWLKGALEAGEITEAIETIMKAGKTAGFESKRSEHKVIAGS
jgi:hypothetical protein